MEQYRIIDLARLSGIKAHTIRVWERRYKIVTPARTGTNRRRYSDNDLRKIINISILRRNGFRISEIAGFSTAETEEKVAFLSKEVFQSDTQIDKLVVAMVSFSERSVSDILMRSLLNRGFEDTVENIIFPFFRRLGLMWQTGSADIGAEHFISNIFRLKLISSIDNLPFPSGSKKMKVILFLPENELHEFGLLFFNYIVRKEGHESIYLGQSAPLSAVADVNRQSAADLIITGLMTGFTGIKPNEYLTSLWKTFPKQKILVAGALAPVADTMKLPNVYAIHSAIDLKKHLVKT